jgi:hypothetical protein
MASMTRADCPRPRRNRTSTVRESKITYRPAWRRTGRKRELGRVNRHGEPVIGTLADDKTRPLSDADAAHVDSLLRPFVDFGTEVY